MPKNQNEFDGLWKQLMGALYKTHVPENEEHKFPSDGNISTSDINRMIREQKRAVQAARFAIEMPHHTASRLHKELVTPKYRAVMPVIGLYDEMNAEKASSRIWRKDIQNGELRGSQPENDCNGFTWVKLHDPEGTAIYHNKWVRLI